MPVERSLEEVMDGGVELTAVEAVAIAQQLIADVSPRITLIPPLGPPTLATVVVQADGSVVCQSCDATPGVMEVANLLDAMLPHGGSARVPGGLRYIIARARLEVVAPPFDSIGALSAALARHEHRDRHAVVGDLYARSVAHSAAQPTARVERRHRGLPASTLRRLLREADEERFALGRFSATVRVVVDGHASDFDPVLVHPRPVAAASVDQFRRHRWPMDRWIAGSAAALLLAFSSGYMAVEHVRSFRRPHPPSATLSSRTSAPNVSMMAPDMRALAPSELVGQTAVATSGVSPEDAGHRELPVARVVARPDMESSSPSFASDGTALFVEAGRSADEDTAGDADRGMSDLRIMRIPDDRAQNYHVQPSPDGARIAFDSDRDGERGVYLANRDGTDVHRVSGPGFAALPTWSPDGTAVTFVRAETNRPDVWNLWRRELATGESRRLTSFPSGKVWSAAWFPAGDRICVPHDDRLIVQDLNGRVVKEYESPVSRHFVRTPAIAPNGRYAIFQVARSGGWLLDFQDGSMRHVLDDPTAEAFAWSPDGRRVAFHSQRDGQWGIWIMATS